MPWSLTGPFSLPYGYLVDGHWTAFSRCNQLTPEQADALFFPGPGGKSGRADTFCSGCPVRNLCLDNAIEHDLDGFFAGTTKDERRQMAFMRDIVVVALTELMPPEPVTRRVYRHIVEVPDVHSWMDDDIESPFDAVASRITTVTRISYEGLIRL